jgi:hypothetical protein
MPRERRLALATRFVAHLGDQGSGRPDRAWILLAAVSRGFAEDAWYAQWDRMLERMASELYWTMISDDLPTLAEAVLDAGRPLSGEVAGLLRRSACAGLDRAALLADRLPEPPLNPGEPWSDRILAELPRLGTRWWNLIPHLRTAGPAPTRRWDRTAAEILDGADPQTVRTVVTPWLALASHGGGADDGGYDAWNVPAVRGLAWLLSALPPHPETVRTLGALVEEPPVKTVVAGAGVRALARLAGEAGQEELHRLARCVDHTVTRKLIVRVLAA